MIGLIGANGKIGTEIVNELKKLLPDIEIKCGCRRPPDDAVGFWETVDITDECSLKKFIDGCELLINSSGKTLVYIPDIPIIELGIQQYCKNAVSDGKNTLLYGCGSVPGMIGLIPRFLSEKMGSIHSLRMDYLINEPLSMTASADMTESYSIPVSKNKTSVAVEKVRESVPFIGDSVYRYRYADEESKGIDKILNVKQSEWSMIRETDDLERILNMSFESRQELAEKLYTLSHIQRQGMENSVQFVTELKCENGTVSCFAKSCNPSVLSAKVCASVASAVINGDIKGEVSLMSLCGDWKKVWNYLNKTQPFDVWAVYQCGLNEIEEEGGEL